MKISLLLVLILIYVGLGCGGSDEFLYSNKTVLKTKTQPKKVATKPKAIHEILNHHEIVAFLSENTFYEAAYNICLPSDKECRMRDFFIKKTFKNTEKNDTSLVSYSEFINKKNILLYNQKRKINIKGNKIFYGVGKGYYVVSKHNEEYLLFQFYDSLNKRDRELDIRLYFEESDAREYYEVLKKEVQKDFKALMVGKTFYYLKEKEFLIALSFDANFTSSTGTVIDGEDKGHTGTAYFVAQGHKLKYDSGGYMELIGYSAEYLSFSIYTEYNPDNSIFVKMFFDKKKAQEYFNFFKE